MVSHRLGRGGVGGLGQDDARFGVVPDSLVELGEPTGSLSPLGRDAALAVNVVWGNLD